MASTNLTITYATVRATSTIGEEEATANIPDGLLVYAAKFDAKSQIRILHIMPDDRTDNMRCHLSINDLEDAGEYAAISYTWGDPKQRGSINIDGVDYSVSWNCYYALWQTRLHGAETVWIDSVCINQASTSEKNHQVAMMGQIYQRASKVMASIGERTQTSERIMEVLRDMQAQKPDQSQGSQGEEGIAWENWIVSKGQTYIEELCELVEDFETQYTYWSRLWIVQELAAGVSKCIEVLCGGYNIPWMAIKDLLQLYEHMTNMWDPMLPFVAQEETAHSLLALFRTVHGAPMRLQDLGEVWRQECQDVRDKIYGTLSLVSWSKDSPPIIPDYQKCVTDLACEVLEHFDDDGDAVREICLWLRPALSRKSLYAKYYKLPQDLHGEISEHKRPMRMPIRRACRIFRSAAGLMTVDVERLNNVDESHRCRHAHALRQAHILTCAEQEALKRDSICRPTMIYNISGEAVLAASKSVQVGDIVVETFFGGAVVIRRLDNDSYIFVGNVDTMGLNITAAGDRRFCNCFPSNENQDWDNLELTLWLTKPDTLFLEVDESLDLSREEETEVWRSTVILRSHGGPAQIRTNGIVSEQLFTHLLENHLKPEEYCHEWVGHGQRRCGMCNYFHEGFICSRRCEKSIR